MRIPTILGILFVGGYIVFEISNLHRQQYRLEPLFIFEEFVTADHASQRCGEPDAGERQDFLNNYEVVTRRALEDLRQREPALAEDVLKSQLDDLRDRRVLEVDAAIDANGCEEEQVWRWVKLHEVRSRLNLR